MRTIMLLLLAFFVFGCDKKNANVELVAPVSAVKNNWTIYLDGACGVNNDTVYYENNVPSYAYYDGSTQSLQLDIGSTSLARHLTFILHLSDTGKTVLSNLGSMTLSDSAKFICTSAGWFNPDSVRVTVTKFENVGGKIEGNWGGRLTTETGYFLNANGAFSLRREQ